jgi:hypothetical protein
VFRFLKKKKPIYEIIPRFRCNLHVQRDVQALLRNLFSVRLSPNTHIKRFKGFGDTPWRPIDGQVAGGRANSKSVDTESCGKTYAACNHTYQDNFLKISFSRFVSSHPSHVTRASPRIGALITSANRFICAEIWRIYKKKTDSIAS